MRKAIRLVTIADLGHNVLHKSRVSVAARLGVVLSDGSSLMLFDDRGYSTNQQWSEVSVEDIKENALAVVGPERADNNPDLEATAMDYWEDLSEILEGRDIDVDPAELRELPREVRLSQRLLKRLDAAIQDQGGTHPGQ